MWERVIQQLPLSSAYTPRACYTTAVVYSQELGEYQKGIDYYQQVVDNWPDYAFAWHAQFFVGKYYEKLRNSGGIADSEANPKIEQAYISVVEKYPDSKSAPSAALKLGQMNFKKGQWIEAAMYFELYRQKCSDNQQWARVVYDLGRAYENAGAFEEAIEVYDEFIKTAEPDDPRVKTVKARLEELKGRSK